MSKRLEILKKSLIKKNNLFDDKLQNHINTVKQANGQPLNDKRNGQATLNKWERQNDSLRSLKDSIKKTEEAIEKEEGKIKGVEYTNTFIPDAILKLVEAGELNQWRKHPHTFFVPDVDKARITWDNKRKAVTHKYAHQITDKDQRIKFVRLYNSLNVMLNGDIIVNGYTIHYNDFNGLFSCGNEITGNDYFDTLKEVQDHANNG